MPRILFLFMKKNESKNLIRIQMKDFSFQTMFSGYFEKSVQLKRKGFITNSAFKKKRKKKKKNSLPTQIKPDSQKKNLI